MKGNSSPCFVPGSKTSVKLAKLPSGKKNSSKVYVTRTPYLFIDRWGCP